MENVMQWFFPQLHDLFVYASSNIVALNENFTIEDWDANKIRLLLRDVIINYRDPISNMTDFDAFVKSVGSVMPTFAPSTPKKKST